jgi:hypothetical protein
LRCWAGSRWARWPPRALRVAFASAGIWEQRHSSHAQWAEVLKSFFHGAILLCGTAG